MDSPVNEQATKTATEVLIDTLGEFGEDEPSEFMVIYKAASGLLCYRSNIGCVSHRIGMLETIKAFNLHTLLHEK